MVNSELYFTILIGCVTLAELILNIYLHLKQIAKGNHIQQDVKELKDHSIRNGMQVSSTLGDSDSTVSDINYGSVRVCSGVKEG